jgi:repressor LexA
MDTLGTKLRRQRRRLGLTLDELAGRTSISKPYLSLIETGRVPNPPSDEKLRRLEQTLGFATGELLTQAHLQRTPRDVRAMLDRLIGKGTREIRDKRIEHLDGDGPDTGTQSSPFVPPSLGDSLPDSDHLLHDLLNRALATMETRTSNPVPVINRPSDGYPQDFTDLSYPRRVADEYAACPNVHDKYAFAARVHGDSMTPKYREGDIVIFSPAESPRSGDDCFIHLSGGQCAFKRIFFESADDGSPSVRLQPRNETHRPQIVNSEQIAGVYKAIYRYQRVDGD